MRLLKPTTPFPFILFLSPSQLFVEKVSTTSFGQAITVFTISTILVTLIFLSSSVVSPVKELLQTSLSCIVTLIVHVVTLITIIALKDNTRYGLLSFGNSHTLAITNSMLSILFTVQFTLYLVTVFLERIIKPFKITRFSIITTIIVRSMNITSRFQSTLFREIISALTRLTPIICPLTVDILKLQ